MTLAGIVTLVGLLVTFFYVRADRTCTCVHKAWWFVFLTFCSLTTGHNLGLPGFWWYAVPALLSIGAMLLAFRERRTPAMWLFTSIFGINIAGNMLGLDAYKLATVDTLDVLAWVQIALLMQLRLDNPDMGLTYSRGSSDNNTKKKPNI